MKSHTGNTWHSIWAFATIALVIVALGVAVIAPVAADEVTRGVYPAVAVSSLLIWILLVAVTYSIRSFRIEVAAWAAWLAGAITLALSLGPITLWYLGRDGLGYQVSQALGVGGTPYGFGDMDVVLSWLACPREGIDPYSPQAATCAVGPSNYGPAVFWLSPTGLDRSAAPILGVVGVILSALAIVWLARQSRGLARLSLVILSGSAAWILLQERANLDAAIIWSAVFLVWLVRSRRGLWPWVVAAVPILILGAWKYYPFAMAVALVPVLRIRHGWTVLVGFVTVAVGYLIWMRDYVALSLNSNSNLSGGEFWGIGRDVAAAFIAGEAEVRSGWGWADILLGLVIAAAILWGWSCRGRVSTRDVTPGQLLRAVPWTAEAMLAFSGASATLVAIGISGFGYHYKAALLLLSVPLLGRLLGDRRTSAWRASMFVLVLIVIGMFVTSNLLLSSLSTLVVAAFVGGLSSRTLMSWVTMQRTRRYLITDQSVRSSP